MGGEHVATAISYLLVRKDEGPGGTEDGMGGETDYCSYKLPAG